ncbi:hypothetical protein GS8_1711 [Geobacillus stearothermophilus]|uniref:Uncharacterized protein n=1 Tax=Geobacillus stearothermophilus TaxID=1422 RepID=A0A150MRX9_GEOSE|nr:hypothetical protein GS8_1711 [Geobacillus stearothermophilus]KYD27181.1 hypothetical protein B4109_0551 [Geobacillus stearothermophilus]
MENVTVSIGLSPLLSEMCKQNRFFLFPLCNKLAKLNISFKSE